MPSGVMTKASHRTGELLNTTIEPIVAKRFNSDSVGPSKNLSSPGRERIFFKVSLNSESNSLR